MIHYEIKKKSKQDSLTSYWSIELCLIISFYAERDRYCRLNVFFVILQMDPIWFEDSFIKIFINLSKKKFYNATSDKCLENDANKICFTFTAFGKNDIFNCMHFFVFGYI